MVTQIKLMPGLHLVHHERQLPEIRYAVVDADRQLLVGLDLVGDGPAVPDVTHTFSFHIQAFGTSNHFFTSFNFVLSAAYTSVLHRW